MFIIPDLGSVAGKTRAPRWVRWNAAIKPPMIAERTQKEAMEKPLQRVHQFGVKEVRHFICGYYNTFWTRIAIRITQYQDTIDNL